MRYAYLHGFASSPEASKAKVLAKRFSEHGVELLRPDLNQPSFEALSQSAMLAEVDRITAGGDKFCFVGSSLGGWVAARWAELHPLRVHRLVLLCPGFDMVARWPSIVGLANFEAWKRDGSLPLPDAQGTPRRVHWGFVEEAARQPATPTVPCPTRILHGKRDETVPIEVSRRYAREHGARVKLVELDDDHRMIKSSERVAEVALDFFGLDGP